MKRKVICFLLIASVLVFSPGSAVMAQDDSLDIEKTAIMAIKNSQQLETLNKNLDNAKKAAENADNNAINAKYSGGKVNVQAMVLGQFEAENTLKEIENNKQEATNSVRLTAYTQYINLLKANYAVNVQKELVDNLERDYKSSQLQLNTGIISSSDERLVEINYLKAVYQFNSFQKKLDSAYMAINNLGGVDLDKRYSTLLDNNITPVSQIRSLDDYIKDALTNRSEIVNAQNTLDTKKKEWDYGKTVYSNDYDFYCKQNEYAINSAQNTLDEEKVSIQLELTNGYKSLQNSMRSLESQQANYNLAETNVKAAQVQYDNSMITLKQMEDAKIAMAQAQMNLKNAQFDAWLNQIKMDMACGPGPGIQ